MDVQSLTAAADVAATLYEPWPIDEQRFVAFERAASLAYAAAASSPRGPSQGLIPVRNPNTTDRTDRHGVLCAGLERLR